VTLPAAIDEMPPGVGPEPGARDDKFGIMGDVMLLSPHT